LFKNIDSDIQFNKLEEVLAGLEQPHTVATLSDDPVKWTTQVRMLKGEPFTFNRRDYLLPIYRDVHQNIFVVKGRQVEFTEFAINWLLFHLSKNPFTTGFYSTDTLEKVSSFSNVRLKEQAVRDSLILRDLLVDDGNVHHVSLTNGSHLYMYSGFKEFKMARGFTIDFGVIDEAQSQELGAINVIEEAQSHSKYRRKLVLGTGALEGGAWFKLWHTGDQKHWDSQAKAWVAKHPENASAASSYHLPQWLVPWIPAEEIEKKRKLYIPRLFTTEVEGWWYKGLSKPLTEQEIRSLFDTSIDFTSPDDIDRSKGPVLMGVDWGGGTQAFTVAWIWQCLDFNIPSFRLLYVTRIDERSTEKQADMIANLVDSYRIDQGIMDAGGGARQVEKLSNRYGNRMMVCTYIERPEDPIEFVYRENRVLADRTWIIDTVIDLITRRQPHPAIPNGIPRIAIPAHDEIKVQWLIDNFTCIESESYQTRGGKQYVRYVHPEEQPDDALHACNYAYLAFLRRRGSGGRHVGGGITGDDDTSYFRAHSAYSEDSAFGH
jgi:hypothetical protein